MTKGVTRRSFLKIAAGIGAATGLSPSIRRVVLEPYVRPPEEELPGRATWYASTCRQCPAGCGIIVRVINGRPRKIEGNPDHPLNRGKLCARGQAGLQLLYNPDRLRNAVRQSGGRGSRIFEPILWSEALDQLASILGSTSGSERVAFLSGVLPDHLHTLAARFMQSLGSPPPVIFDLHSTLEGRQPAIEMSSRWFGNRNLLLYDISQAEVIFSFGANLFETWMSPVSQSIQYGFMRQGQARGRGFLAQIEPRLSATAASADEWIPVPPGTEGMVALAMGRIIVEDNLGRVGSHREHAHLYRDVNLAEVAEATGLTIEQLSRLANLFAASDRPLAIPGGYLSGIDNGPQAMDAVLALNIIARRLGREGGVFLPHDVPAENFEFSNQPSSFAQLQALIDRMQAGQVEVLFIHGSNPIYELPDWTGFRQALESVALVVSTSSFIDETAAASDLVLPDHTYLEAWGYQVVSPGADRPTVSAQQPVSQALYDTQSTADLLLALTARLGGRRAESLPWTDEVAFLEEMSARLLGSSVGAYDARTPAGFWSRWRQFGGWWSEKSMRKEPEALGLPGGSLEVPAPLFAGEVSQYPYHLVPFVSLTLSDGRGANQPWLQETPDPITTTRWNSWVEMHPETAARHNLADNDLVRVVSPAGSLEAPVVVHPGIRPDAVAIPTGQGHMDYGRFAAGRGSNVIDLIAPSPDGSGKLLPWAATRVRLETVGQTRKLARLESIDGQGRETIR